MVLFGCQRKISRFNLVLFGLFKDKFLRCIFNKKDRCIDLYYGSNEYNITYCHEKIYKILGEISNEILEAQQLLSDIGESSDYESLIAQHTRQKRKSRGIQKYKRGIHFLSRGIHFLIGGIHFVSK